MHVLALEPYFAGSHAAFLDGWRRNSRHTWTLLTLPGHHWKWRMRHAPITLAEQVRERSASERWDVVFCSDMLNLAEFRGLANPVAHLPTIVYFHENQLTYPSRNPDARDLHFAMSNFMTALAADEVWFNSDYHRNDMFMAMRQWLSKMPDYSPIAACDTLLRKSAVMAPGIEPLPQRPARRSGPLRILWAARWEHDKNPECFFAALQQLHRSGTDFRISVLGESFRDAPAVFEAARREFTAEIDHWGFAVDRQRYAQILLDADVFASTARHEFFGIAAVEAIAAGAYPLLPRRLSYPGLIAGAGLPSVEPYLYDGGATVLAARLQQLAASVANGRMWPADDSACLRDWARRFTWPMTAARLDEGLERIASKKKREFTTE